MDPSFEPERIIRTLAYALRHNPWQFGLDLDPEGWTPVDQLVESLRFLRYDWALLEWSHVEIAIRGSDRYEVRGGRIRAAYGHSITLGNPPAVAVPPPILFHGTSQGAVADILQHGILRMTRRFVHFSSDIDWVAAFLSDKPAWTIVTVLTEAAVKHGTEFRQANHHVWLAESMDPRFLVIHSSSACGAWARGLAEGEEGEGISLHTTFRIGKPFDSLLQ